MPAVNPTASASLSPKIDLALNKNPSVNLDTTVSVTTRVITNTFPIQGVVYQPIDIPGEIVNVQSDISNFYYLVGSNTTGTQVYWDTQPLSQQRTNDTYSPYTLK